MVDKELFDAYEAALGANAALFSRAVRDLADEVDGMTAKDMRTYLMGRYPSLVRAYGTVAAEAAREFYEAQRAAAGGAAALGYYEAATAYPERLDGESAVQVNAVTARDGKPSGDSVYSYLGSQGTRSVMSCVDSTLNYNASRDPANPKWALVPHVGACSWCVMIGSRGFMYHSERSVGAQRHNNCKCTPVVDFDTKNPKLEGYDPGKLYEQYRESEASGETSFGQRRPTSGRSYGPRKKRAVGAPASHAQASKLIEYLEGATSPEDYQKRALKVDEQWNKSKHMGNAFDRIRKRHVELSREWGVDPKERPKKEED